MTDKMFSVKRTLDKVGNTTALPGLLNQFDTPVSHFLANGAYDGTPTNTLLRARFGETVEIIAGLAGMEFIAAAVISSKADGEWIAL